jgi:hypothetical protein
MSTREFDETVVLIRQPKMTLDRRSGFSPLSQPNVVLARLLSPTPSLALFDSLTEGGQGLRLRHREERTICTAGRQMQYTKGNAWSIVNAACGDNEHADK